MSVVSPSHDPDPAGRATRPIRILIADGQPLFRRGLAHALAETADLRICAEADTAEQALPRILELRPDLVLLDLTLPGGVWPLLESTLAQWPAARIATLAAAEQSDEMLASMRAGAKAYLPKGMAIPALCAALRAVAGGEGYVPPALAARVLGGLRLGHGPRPACPDAARRERLTLLTRREREVLDSLAAGQSNKEIALRHDMQEKTVKNHVSHILHKLQVRNRTEAALMLRERRRHPPHHGPLVP